MEFYLSIDGEKQGPYTSFKVGELLRSGAVDADSLGWHRDLDGWKPLREIVALELVVERETKPPEPPPLPPEALNPTEARPEDAAPRPVLVRNVRPFTRFWARMFDISLVFTIVHFFIDTSFISPREDETFSDWMARYAESLQSDEVRAIAFTILFSLFAWQFIEAVLIHLVGTTPGKALLGIRVARPDGSRLPLLRSLGRSLYVYTLGVGFYLNPFLVIGMTFSFFRLMATGRCLWDQHLEVEVETAPLNAGRIVLAICAFFALVIFQSMKIS